MVEIALLKTIHGMAKAVLIFKIYNVVNNYF